MRGKSPKLDKELIEAFEFALLFYPGVRKTKGRTKRALKEVSDVKRVLMKKKGKKVRKLLRKQK